MTTLQKNSEIIQRLSTGFGKNLRKKLATVKKADNKKGFSHQ